MVSNAMEKKSLIYANNCPGDHGGFLETMSSSSNDLAYKCNRCNQNYEQCYGCSICNYWLCIQCRTRPFQCGCCLENVEILIFDTHCLFPCCIQYSCLHCACKGLDLVEFVEDLNVHYELKYPIISAIKNHDLNSLKNVCSNIRWRNPKFSLPMELRNIVSEHLDISIFKIFKEMLDPNFTSLLNLPENKLLKQNLFRIFLEDKLTQNTALHYAAIKGDVNFAQFLLNRTKKNIVNRQNVFGYTPLHFAAAMGEYDIVQILLAQGANVNPIGTNGKTPLHITSEMGHIEITVFLIGHGGKSNQIEWYGCSPLTHAIKVNKKNIIEKSKKKAISQLDHFSREYNMCFLAKLITCKILMIPTLFCLSYQYQFFTFIHSFRNCFSTK